MSICRSSSSGCCSNVFSLGQIDGHRYYYSLVPKTSSWVENCTKFGQFVLSKIIKIVASRCHIIFKAEMHQIRFRLGLRPRPRWGSSYRSLRPPSWMQHASHYQHHRRHQTYLQVFVPVESNVLDLAICDVAVTLVATDDNRDVFTYAFKIFEPIRHVLVCDW